MKDWLDQTTLYLYEDWDRVKFPEIININRLHIIVKSPVPNKHIREIVEFASKFKYLSILISHCVDNKYDLSFLENFPNLNSFSLFAHQFTEFEQLRFIPEGIDRLVIYETKSLKLSLSFLTRFKKLKTLSLERHKKDIEVLSELTYLKKLAIKSITLPDLSIIQPIKGLEELEIRLGGTKNLDLLPSFKKLTYLELWAIYKITNIDPIADTTSLERIFLDQLKNVEDVKSLKKLTNLKWIGLCRMKGLKSLQWVADAPALEKFSITQTTHLGKNAFLPFLKHKTLRAADIYIGKNKSFEVREMLGLPEIETKMG